MTVGEKRFILLLRLLMAWTFPYAASHQVFVPDWSVVGFLNKTKTFHDVFAVFTRPNVAPIITNLVGYGHLLIGLSFLVGLMVRTSAAFGSADARLLDGAYGLSLYRKTPTIS